MPSKEDICVVPETLPANFLSPDVEELVAAIKHNLQLKARPRHSMCSKQRRMSPYSAPVRTLCKQSMGDKENTSEHSCHSCKYCILRSKSPISDDPYEMLQVLLREGSLIKEAVKRLQLGIENERSKKTDFYDLDIDEVDINVESI
ncbi:uncharacterized protein LOC118192309 [Stegodyphus dumicola]|uniref:uncharacterized protein LOC118192309 n=1 Tax=Stegodyphus dumicola TaxID=202533 RepID=UPI0015B26474|nr:uncharacterized protein LOC118192309 [Stegodyphus dumicola]